MFAQFAFMLALAAEPPAPQAGGEAQIGKRVLTVPPRTPLYCEDGAHTIEPLIYGDLGDLIAAYDRLEHMSGEVVSGGKRAGGEDYDVLLFAADADNKRSPGEAVGYVITHHADGYAIRSAYDAPKDLPPQKIVGTELCAFVLKMLVDSDPARATAFRKRWGEQHPDSTSH